MLPASFKFLDTDPAVLLPLQPDRAQGGWSIGQRWPGAAGLMIRTFVAMRQVDPGFVRPEEVQTFRIEVPGALISDMEEAVRTHDQIAQRRTAFIVVPYFTLAKSTSQDL